jgi:hypothetical protein
VENQFQSLPFKCNLQRYNEVKQTRYDGVWEKGTVGPPYQSNPVDPQLETAWLQPLSLPLEPE